MRFAQMVRRWWWRLSGLIVVLLIARYGYAVVRTFGVDSPLARSRTVVTYYVGEVFRADVRRVLSLTQRLSPNKAEMNNESFGEMRTPTSMEQLRFADTPASPGEQYRVIPGLARTETGHAKAGAPPALDDAALATSWANVAGGDSATRHSPLDEIRAETVGGLKLLHVVDSLSTFNSTWSGQVEVSPLFWDSTVYWISADERLIAVDVGTGAIRWAHRLPSFGYSRRGFVIDPHATGGPTLYVPFGRFIAGIDAKSGALTAAFGGDGIVELDGFTTVAPIVWHGQLVVGLYDTQIVTGIDLVSGAVEWTLPLHAADRNFEGGAPWSGMAIDRPRSRLFITTGNPRPALSGISRPGDNAPSDSIIAIDLVSHSIAWTFQEVRHDLWDYDIASGPMLTRIHVDGRPFDVVVAVTKMGNTLIVDRETGRPVFDFRLSKAPAARQVHEETSPYQPDLETPEPLMDITFDPSMVTDVSPESTVSVTRQFTEHGTIFGRFVPPQLNKDLVVFGVHGGAEWHGAAIDPVREMMYVPVNMIPWMLRVYVHAKPGYSFKPAPNDAGAALYASKCASCHLPSRNGQFATSGEAATQHVPALHGYTLLPDNRALFEPLSFVKHHQVPVTASELSQIWTTFQTWDADIFANGQPTMLYHWRQLLDHQRLPGTKPPWGKLVAMHLSTGRKVWEQPLGEKLVNGQPANTGAPSYGGVISTAGGLAFAVGTDDALVRAIDLATGETRWRYKMAAAGSAPPITFTANGKQYVCVVATGGRFHNFTDRASRLYIFGL